MHRIATCLYLIALFLIPFENLWFAPSTGWAALAPIPMFLSALFYLSATWRLPRQALNAMALFGLLFVVSSVSYLTYRPHVEIFLDRTLTLGLGFGMLVATFGYFSVSSRPVLIRRLRSAAIVLAVAYGIAILYGLAFVAVHELEFSTGVEFFKRISKRYYGTRYALTFTEPSFVTMHIWGVLFPLLFTSRQLKDRYSTILFGSAFLSLIAFSLLFVDSTRLLLDTAIITLLLLSWSALRSQRALLSLLIVGIIAIGAGSVAADKLGARFTRMIEAVKVSPLNAISSDASLASRFFRIDAILSGMPEQPYGLFFGYGFANTSYPFAFGYTEALTRFTNPYRTEVIALGKGPQSSYYSMPAELLGNFGLVGLAIVFAVLALALRPRFLLLLLYLYLQFDSYAFYSAWFMIVLTIILRRFESANTEAKASTLVPAVWIRGIGSQE